MAGRQRGVGHCFRWHTLHAYELLIHYVLFKITQLFISFAHDVSWVFNDSVKLLKSVIFHVTTLCQL
jgi:hypothetical protein